MRRRRRVGRTAHPSARARDFGHKGLLRLKGSIYSAYPVRGSGGRTSVSNSNKRGRGVRYKRTKKDMLAHAALGMTAVTGIAGIFVPQPASAHAGNSSTSVLHLCFRTATFSSTKADVYVAPRTASATCASGYTAAHIPLNLSSFVG